MVLLWGVAVWSVATAITAVTSDSMLVPTVILTGTFVIPIAVVVTLVHREAPQTGYWLPRRVILEGFLGGGTVGVLVSALLEGYLMPSKTGTYLVVGLIVPPFGHIAWSSILGGAIFAAASRDARFRVTARLGGVFVGVVALHALWDQAYGWAIMMARASTGAG
jgi:hypothetical protein